MCIRDRSKGHAEYLEARLIEQTAQAGRVTLDNGSQPDTSRQRLPEADIANMEQFLANLRTILPVIGLDMLKPQPKAVTQTAQPIEERTAGEVQFEIRCERSGIRAIAVQEDGEFIVLERSTAQIGYYEHGYGDLKKKLVEAKVLVPYSAVQFRFARPWPFTSPSAAASVVLDRNANGRTEWKMMGASQTYHDWQQAQAVRQEVAK